MFVLNSFLTLMCCLHVYWTYLFLGILVKNVKTGATEDTQRKLVVSSKIK